MIRHAWLMLPLMLTLEMTDRPASAAPPRESSGTGEARTEAGTGPPSPAGSARIVQVAGGMVYLAHGRDRGLEPGQQVPFTRAGRVIGQLELLHVSDHRAAARVKTAERPPRPDDAVLLPPPLPEAPVPARRSDYVVLPEARLEADWKQALELEPPSAIAYTSGKRRDRRRVRAESETAVTGAFDVPELSTARLEQVVSLRGQGTDLGARGLDVRIRADVDLRYDDDADRFLAGRHAWPLVREAAMRYTPPGSPWSAVAGRFRPAVRQAELMEGVQVAWNGRHLGVIGVAGLKPSLLELAPRPEHQTYALALNLHPAIERLRWTGQISYGGDLTSGAFARHTLATDHHLALDRLAIHQSVTLDYLNAGAAADGTTGIDLAAAFLGGNYRLSDRIALNVSGRLQGRTLLAIDAADLPEGWVEGLAGRQVLRAEGGMRLELSDRQSVQPYLFWYEDTRSDAPAVWTAGGGAAWHRDRIGGGPLGLDVSADYGDGTQQRAALQLSINGPVAADRLRLGTGLLHFWTFGHETGLHSFQHLLHARIDGLLLGRFGVWAMAMGGLDWNIAAGPATPGGVVTGEAGATFRW